MGAGEQCDIGLYISYIFKDIKIHKMHKPPKDAWEEDDWDTAPANNDKKSETPQVYNVYYTYNLCLCYIMFDIILSFFICCYVDVVPLYTL